MTEEDLCKLRIQKTGPSPWKRKIRNFSLVLLFLVILPIGYALYQNGLLTPAVPVRVTTVQYYYPSQMFTLLNASGYVAAQRKAAVASKITSQLIYLNVEEGSRVSEGQIIAKFENKDAEAARERAEANVEAAKSNLKEAGAELEVALLAYRRKKQVVQKGFVSELDHDEAEARYKKARESVAARRAELEAGKAALKEAEARVSYGNLKAPFDAVVLTKDADVGDIVTPLGAAANAKAAVVTIADLDSLQVEADVSESSIQQVQVGQPCEIQLDALPGERFRGRVHMIVPTANRSKATVLVKVAFVDKDRRVLPEMSATVAFLSQEPADWRSNFLALPAEAVVKRGDGNAVYVVRGKRAEQALLELGAKYGNMVCVCNGLRAGDKVILTHGEVKNGTPVTVVD